MKIFFQSGIIPFRNVGKNLEILLITSLNKKNWIIPKGLVEECLSPKESAIKEAYEEAGVSGEIHAATIGEYQYQKWGGICIVQVFPFSVTKIHEQWPESAVRNRRWFTYNQAVAKITNIQLRVLFTKFAKRHNNQSQP